MITQFPTHCFPSCRNTHKINHFLFAEKKKITFKSVLSVRKNFFKVIFQRQNLQNNHKPAIVFVYFIILTHIFCLKEKLTDSSNDING